MTDRTDLAAALVSREALYLDQQEWEKWLSLYLEDSEFWMPTWRAENELTDDPATELSFMFLRGRKKLEERVFRVNSGRSAASIPLPRTSHVLGSASVVLGDGGARATVHAPFVCHVYHQKDASLASYAGRYEHDLLWANDQFHIRRKKIIVINDRLQSQVDFFYV